MTTLLRLPQVQNEGQPAITGNLFRVAVPAASRGRLVVAGGCRLGFGAIAVLNTKAQRCCTKGQYPRAPILSDTECEISGIFESSDVHLEWPSCSPLER